MHLKTRFAVLVSGLSLMLAPAAALAHGVEYEVESPPKTKPKPGPDASLAQKTKAYGTYCRAFPKKHVAGRPGTPFSQCVTAMAKVATSRSTTAGRACAGFSKQPVAGQGGTPFAKCVVAAGKVRKQLRS
jgi:hypothetical protein